MEAARRASRLVSAPAAIVRLRDLVDAWFTAPEPNAAGRMGLFRIVYALFYLWHLSLFELASMSGMPSSIQRKLVFFDLLSVDLSPAAFDALEKALVAALVMLLVGWRVRLATVVVLFLGVLREACRPASISRTRMSSWSSTFPSSWESPGGGKRPTHSKRSSRSEEVRR